jgi:hypothetical protein
MQGIQNRRISVADLAAVAGTVRSGIRLARDGAHGTDGRFLNKIERGLST